MHTPTALPQPTTRIRHALARLALASAVSPAVTVLAAEAAHAADRIAVNHNETPGRDRDDDARS
jgi:hypothetical protein